MRRAELQNKMATIKHAHAHGRVQNKMTAIKHAHAQGRVPKQDGCHQAVPRFPEGRR